MTWSLCVVCLCKLLKDVANSRSVMRTVGDTDQKAELVATLIATAAFSTSMHVEMWQCFYLRERYKTYSMQSNLF